MYFEERHYLPLEIIHEKKKAYEKLSSRQETSYAFFFQGFYFLNDSQASSAGTDQVWAVIDEQGQVKERIVASIMDGYDLHEFLDNLHALENAKPVLSAKYDLKKSSMNDISCSVEVEAIPLYGIPSTGKIHLPAGAGVIYGVCSARIDTIEGSDSAPDTHPHTVVRFSARAPVNVCLNTLEEDAKLLVEHIVDGRGQPLEHPHVTVQVENNEQRLLKLPAHYRSRPCSSEREKEISETIMSQLLMGEVIDPITGENLEGKSRLRAWGVQSVMAFYDVIQHRIGLVVSMATQKFRGHAIIRLNEASDTYIMEAWDGRVSSQQDRTLAIHGMSTLRQRIKEVYWDELAANLTDWTMQDVEVKKPEPQYSVAMLADQTF